jgi:hypothetical protein
MLAKALQKLGIPFQQLSYADQNHGISEFRPHLFAAMLKFWTEDCFGYKIPADSNTVCEITSEKRIK